MGNLAHDLYQHMQKMEADDKAYEFRDYIYEQLDHAYKLVTDAEFSEQGMRRLRKRLDSIFSDILQTVK